MSLRELQYKKVHNEAFDLFKKKNNDYGDAFANFGPVGVIMRMQDKMSRFIQVNQNKIEMVKDEKLRDTIIDLHNYCAMAIMLMDEDKQNSPQYNMNSDSQYLMYLDDDSDYGPQLKEKGDIKNTIFCNKSQGYSFNSISSIESPSNNK